MNQMRFGALSPSKAVTAITMFALGALVLLVAGGASAAVTPASAAKTVVITTRTLPKLGSVLVDSKGYTLYMFVPDKDKKVTCVSTCAVMWPPVFLPTGAKPVAKGAAEVRLLGSDSDPAGGRVVTYAGWPLYRWVGDSRPGMDTGQAVNVNGGLWYVVSPAGKVIRTDLLAEAATVKKAPTSAKTTTSTTSTTSAPTVYTAPGASTTATAPAGPPYNESDAACAPGQTIVTTGNTDGDGDETAVEPSDGDGCI